MRRMLLVVVLLSFIAAPAVPAFAGDGAHVDRAEDCFFPVRDYWATGLRTQKVKTPVDSGQFHCHGMINDLSQAPDEAVRLQGGVCFLPFYFGDRPGVGKAVITPNGHINLTCKFSLPTD